MKRKYLLRLSKEQLIQKEIALNLKYQKLKRKYGVLNIKYRTRSRTYNIKYQKLQNKYKVIHIRYILLKKRLLKAEPGLKAKPRLPSVKPAFIKERRRKQIVIYRKSPDAPSPEVYAEIRIATINPEITLKGLWVVLNRIKGRYPKINFTDVGLEEDEPISLFEDVELNDNNIHIKILAYGKESSSIISPF